MENQTQQSDTGCIGPDHHPGMIRLPIAPTINNRIRFAPLSKKKELHIYPHDAVNRVQELFDHGAHADAVLLYGPGDPLADIEPTLETMKLFRESFPDLTIVVRTLGIGGLKYADKLAQAGLQEIEVLVDGVDPTVLEKIYAWVRPGFKTLKLSEGVSILCDEQAQAIQAFKDAGMKVRLITTYYPTANDDHIGILVKKAAELGADEMVLHPYAPEAEADITLPTPDPEKMEAVITELSATLPIHQGRPVATRPLVEATAQSELPKPMSSKPNVAVVSTNGMDIDLHLGQAPQILVYGPREDGLACLLDCRPAPETGAGKERWDILAERIPDCFALLAASAGERPRKILSQHGIQVIVTQENIEGTVDVLYGGGKKGKGCKTQPRTP